MDAKKQDLVVALSLPEEDTSKICDKVFTEVDRDLLKAANGLAELLKYLKAQF